MGKIVGVSVSTGGGQLASNSKLGYVRAKAMSAMYFEELPRIRTLTGATPIPQTKVVCYQQNDLGGNLPTGAVNNSVLNQLMHLSTIRKFFDQSAEIDRARRAAFVNTVEHGGEQV